jgi:hypothetical protein
MVQNILFEKTTSRISDEVLGFIPRWMEAIAYTIALRPLVHYWDVVTPQ